MDIISRASNLRFDIFGLPHILTLVVMVILNVVALYYSRKRNHNYYRNYLIVSLIVLDILYRLWGLMIPRNMVITASVHISSASVILAIILLINFKQKIFDVFFFWAILIVPQALITPGTIYGFPHLRFFHILWIHINIIFALIYLLLIEKRTITRKSLFRSLLATNVYALFVWIINSVFESNYMFINRKPSMQTFLDLLGPYPYYLLSLEGVLIVSFTCLYYIYFRRRKHDTI